MKNRFEVWGVRFEKKLSHELTRMSTNEKYLKPPMDANRRIVKRFHHEGRAEHEDFLGEENRNHL